MNICFDCGALVKALNVADGITLILRFMYLIIKFRKLR